MIKDNEIPRYYRGGILFRLFLFVSFSVAAKAQVNVHYKSSNISLNTYQKSIQGKVEIVVSNNSEVIIDSLHFLFWPAAYQTKGTHLADEFLEDQNASMHFAKEGDLGFVGYQYSTTGYSQDVFIGTQESFEIEINLGVGQTKTIYFTFLEKLPNAAFNGFGYTQNSFQLAQWLPKIVPIQSDKVAPTFNSKNREAWFVPATFDLSISATEEAELVTNLDFISAANPSKNWHIASSNPMLDAVLVFKTGFSEYQIPGLEENVTLHFSDQFPPFNQMVSWQRITEFLAAEWGWKPEPETDIVFLEQSGLKSTKGLYFLKTNQSQEDLEGDLIAEIVSVLAREELKINPAKDPVFVDGLANYYKHLYFEKYYPNKMLLGPFANTIAAKLFDINDYPIHYQNRMLYLYMARQGLDQPLSDPISVFSRANREAVIKGKSALFYSYARSYVGDKNFKRSMHRWYAQNSSVNSPQTFVNQLNYFHNRPTDWLLGELYTTNKKLDFSLTKTENCSSVYTATIKNKGKLVTPYSITGFKDSTKVLTEWFDGHAGKRTVQIHLEDYTRVVLDADEAMPEVNQKNNSVKTTGLFKRIKPLKLQFYTSFDNPEKTQIFWLPSLKYNAYDQFLIGAQFYNSNLFRKPFEYRISPDYSTGTGSLTGMASFRFNWTPTASPFHLISLALYGRYYHYDNDLAYLRLSPTLTLNFRKPTPRSEWINTLRLRSVSVDKQTPNNPDDFKPIHDNANYQIFDIRYKAEKGALLTPFIGIIDLQASEYFFKASVDIKQRWRLAKNYLLTARLFAGTGKFSFTNGSDPEFFQYGLSGTQDYLFDYYFLGRSDNTGIWSQQMFVTDGGFKSETKTFGEHMFAANINVPFFRFFGAFGDIGYVVSPNVNEVYWDYGLYLEFIPDFIEIYFPIQSSQEDIISQPEYYKEIRFVLNLNFDAIINRVRRGLY